MITPKLMKVRKADLEVKAKVEKVIKETLQNEHIMSYSISGFNSSELDLLAEYADENNIFISLKAEHSNVYQGVLVQLLKKDLLGKFITYM